MSDLPTPCDVPGTSDHAWEQEQMRRDAEIDGRCVYPHIALLREWRDAERMRARARAIEAGHPSAQHVSTGGGAAAPRRTPVDIHFAAPDNGSVEQRPQEVSPPPAEPRTPPPTQRTI